MSKPTFVDAEGKVREDRRSNHALREKAERAFAIIRPFFDEHNQWAGHSLDHMAYRVLREQMPNLTREEVHVIVVAAARVLRPPSHGE